jgi:regulator of sigma E protease
LSGVTEGSAAYDAGLDAGDEIVSMGGKKIHFFRDVSSFTQFHQGETVDVTYVRDGEKHTVALTPRYNEEYGYYMYGLIGGAVRGDGNLFEVLKYSVYEVEYWINTTLSSLKMLVTGGAGLSDMTGPVGIVNMIGDSYEESVSYGYRAAILQLLYIGIFLSANLGVMNLLPLPALDGGRLFFMLIELIRGKRVDPEKEGMVHFAGMMLLLALMVFIMFNDIKGLV